MTWSNAPGWPQPQKTRYTFGFTWMWPPKYAMLPGTGSPATGGPTGMQQTAGGCSAGLVMFSAFGM